MILRQQYFHLKMHSFLIRLRIGAEQKGASGQYHRGEGARPLGYRSLARVNGQMGNLFCPRHLPTTTRKYSVKVVASG